MLLMLPNPKNHAKRPWGTRKLDRQKNAPKPFDKKKKSDQKLSKIKDTEIKSNYTNNIIRSIFLQFSWLGLSGAKRQRRFFYQND